MSLSAKYQTFLARPSPDALAEDACVHYITTLTSIKTAPFIIKHLAVQEKLLKKKGEKVLNAVEGSNALTLEIDTTIEFVSGGGAYLPGLDDNFIADRTVSFPMVHIVHFDDSQKISQIRLYWDQGSLLKQIDVIGARARNWPIRDGLEQARLIATSAASAPASVPASASFKAPAAPANAPSNAPAASSRRPTASRGPDDVTITERPASSRSNASTGFGNRPTLDLFQHREEEQNVSSFAQPTGQRAYSQKPKPRDMSELFGHEDGEGSQERFSTKSGAGKNYKESRIFDEGEPTPIPAGVKTSPKKYDHFNMVHGEEDEATPRGRTETKAGLIKTKHQSQWGFEDFVTPDKPKPKVLPAAVRHFGWSEDEDEKSPVRRPVVHKPRPDADPHFQFEDAGTPAADRKQFNTAKGRSHNKGLGLYEDHVTHTTSDNEDEQPHKGDVKRPLGDVTTALKNEKPNLDNNGNGGIKHGEDRERNLKGLEAHWGLYEDSPPPAKKENAQRGIQISGNGMGGKKGAGSNWSINGDEDYVPTPPRKIQINGNGMGGKKDTGPAWAIGGDENDVPTPPKKIQISGNGMGGKKDTGPAWAIGGDENDVPTPAKKIQISGNGMGGKKGAGSNWSIGGDDDYVQTPPKKIQISGNGMGGKKGTESSWAIGEDEDAEIKAPKKGPAAESRNFWDF